MTTELETEPIGRSRADAGRDPATSVSKGLCTVFGGTGFLGHRIVRNLLQNGWRVRIAVRHPEKGRSTYGERVQTISTDITAPDCLSRALERSDAVVNAVSLYAETDKVGFEDVHVTGAMNVAKQAAAAGVGHLIHVSGIGSDPDATDAYVSARGKGEKAVRQAFPGAVLARPSAMFGHGEALLGTILGRLRQLPVFPLFGSGETRLQPVHADDVAQAVVTTLDLDEPQTSYDLGGPRVYTYRELVLSIARSAGVRPRLVPVPFPLWELAARLLPNPPLTLHQVALMRQDNVAQNDGMRLLSVTPRPLELVVQDIVQGR